MKLSNRTYDILKWLCLIALPALSVLYSALDRAFGWGMADTVGTVIAAVAAFIGTLIGVSCKSCTGEGGHV